MFNKYYVYILHNNLTDRFYIGSTNNIERRLNEHLMGKMRTTRLLKTDELVYLEEYETDADCRIREKQLKSYKSKKYLKWLMDVN